MSESQQNDGFVSFICPSCHQEIEGSLDMIGQTVECPACGTKLKVPATSEPGTSRNPVDPSKPANQQPSQVQIDAMKSRTIRIELGSL